MHSQGNGIENISTAFCRFVSITNIFRFQLNDCGAMFIFPLFFICQEFVSFFKTTSTITTIIYYNIENSSKSSCTHTHTHTYICTFERSVIFSYVAYFATNYYCCDTNIVTIVYRRFLGCCRGILWLI